MSGERGPSGTGREYPPELVHGELCATRFSLKAVCDCGKEPEPGAGGPSGTGHGAARRDPSLDHIQITTSLGELHRHGFVWTHGDRFRYRTWLGLRLLDPGAARLYFNTTRDGGPSRAR